jgi:hypothetical protein
MYKSVAILDGLVEESAVLWLTVIDKIDFLPFLACNHDVVTACDEYDWFSAFVLTRRGPWCQVGVEIPMDSDEADAENKSEGGKTLLYVFERGCACPHDIITLQSWREEFPHDIITLQS